MHTVQYISLHFGLLQFIILVPPRNSIMTVLSTVSAISVPRSHISSIEDLVIFNSVCISTRPY